jgi:sporulation protein YtfJ
MDKQPINELMETVMEKLHAMVDVSTVIGEPINTPDGITIIPVSKVSFGFAAGGSDFTGKNQKDGQKNPFGGGSGAGVKIDPSAFVVVKDGFVRIMNIEPPASTTVDRLIDTAPEIVDKVSDMIKKKSKEKEEE